MTTEEVTTEVETPVNLSGAPPAAFLIALKGARAVVEDRNMRVWSFHVQAQNGNLDCWLTDARGQAYGIRIPFDSTETASE